MTRPPSSLQLEIRQRQPFRSRGQEALLGLLHTVDVLRRRLTQIVDPCGITLQQYNVLRILRGAGPQGLPTLEIADRMIEQAPGITRLMDRLKAKGLVRRQRSPDDRRRVFCRITPPGLEVLATLDKPMADAERVCLGMLRDKDLTTLVRFLDAVRRTHAAPASTP